MSECNHVSKILVGYDGSEGAKKAVEKAISIAKERDEISLVFVVPGTKLETFAGFETDMTKEKAGEMLDEVLVDLRERGIEASGIVKEGNVVEEIVRLASDLDCDLIVVGSHGMSKVGTFALGDVAQEVAKKSTKPVLLVR